MKTDDKENTQVIPTYKLVNFRWKLFGIFSTAILLFCGTVGFYAYNFDRSSLSNSQEVWGQFGDFVGGILNPLFALLAFGALLYTIFLQSKELVLSRKQLEKSATALEKQSNLIERQTFENTFFKLLAVLNRLVENFTCSGLANTNGRAAISFFNSRIQKEFSSLSIGKGPKLESLEKAYNSEFSSESMHLSPLFNNIYHIIHFVDDSIITDNAKKKYLDILDAQLSDNELLLISFFALFDENGVELKKLLEKYRMLENITYSKVCELINSDIISREFITSFDRETYGKNTSILNLYKNMASL